MCSSDLLNLLRPAILSQPTLYSDWLGFTKVDTDDIRAEATANLSTNIFTNGQTVWVYELASGTYDPIQLKSYIVQYNSVHHFQASADSDGYVDIDLLNYSTQSSQYTPVTYLDRLIELNDELRKIKVFKPDVVGQVNAQFQKVLRASQ